MSDLEDVYRSYLACCNQRRFSDLSLFVHDPYRLNGTPISLADYILRLSSIIDAVPDFQWEIQDILANDQKAAVRLTISGTPQAEWRGVAPTGKSMKVAEHAFYTFSEGKIADVWFLVDVPSIRAQLAD